MYSLKDIFDGIKNICRAEKLECADNLKRPTKNILEKDWEVFVIKYDEASGKFVGKTACCALASV